MIRALFLLLRYRFFLFAGLFPYLLGQIIAKKIEGFLNWNYFWLGLIGIFFVLAGVEFFNEYFDAKEGGDRIFSTKAVIIPRLFFPLGLLVFFLAFLIGLFFMFHVGWPILLFSLAGFMAAYFYVGPPLKWAYRGLGEIVISLSYGPFMILGSYYLQTGRIDAVPFFVSLIIATLLFSIAILNEVPDYYQDRLVGKRNLVVRFGKKNAIRLLSSSLFLMYILIILGVILKKISLLGLASFLLLPYIAKGLTAVWRGYENPRSFVTAINAGILTYVAIIVVIGIGCMIG